MKGKPTFVVKDNFKEENRNSHLIQKIQDNIHDET